MEVPGTLDLASPTIPEQALIIARTWIGTPYRHQSAFKGLGTDCIGVICGIWAELYGGYPKSFKMPSYTSSWAEHNPEELMIKFGEKYLEPVLPENAVPGDVIMYRMMRNGPTKHAGILSGEKTMIHAYSPHKVMETALVSNEGSELTHIFRFPTNPQMD